jgi:hypothetical protein
MPAPVAPPVLKPFGTNDLSLSDEAFTLPPGETNLVSPAISAQMLLRFFGERMDTNREPALRQPISFSPPVAPVPSSSATYISEPAPVK